MGRKLKLSYNYYMVKPSMLSSVLFTCSRAGYEENQQAALWLIGEQPVVLSGFSSRNLRLSCSQCLYEVRKEFLNLSDFK